MDDLTVRIVQYFPILLQGVKATIMVTIGSLIFSTALGLCWALMRTSGIRWLSRVSEFLVNFIRGIPIIVILFYIYFVFPDIGIEVSAIQASILGLGIAYSAYHSENFRAGIEAVDSGQVEAAHSLGMGWVTMMKRVTLPQALRIALPPYGNTMIMMLKDSSQASTITVAELAMQGKLLATSNFDNVTVFTMVAIMYLVMCMPLIYLVKYLEKRGLKR